MAYTGVRVEEVNVDLVNKVYSEKKIDIWDKRLAFYPNQFVYLKGHSTGQQSTPGAICKVSLDRTELHLIQDKGLTAFGLKPKNKEQVMAMSALLDDNISLCVMTGRAGTGKSILSIAAALEKAQQKKYDRIIITKPMSQVGKYDLGSLPGDVDLKFGPYLENYLTNIQQLVGNKKSRAEDLIEQFQIEALPLQLIRGASWVNTFILADEVQTLDRHEMLTLGTRIGQGSKLVVMGDLNQRDEDIAKQATGLYKLMNNKLIKESSLTSAIELIKCERSPLSSLFADVFEEG